MARAQHKLSRRALLAGACAAPAFSRHAGLDPVSTFLPSPAAEEGRWTPDQVRGDDQVAEAWRSALARWSRAEAEVAGLAGVEDEEAYDPACARHDAALAGVLGGPAPDGAAAAWKLELIAGQRVFELDCWDAAVAVLAQDLRRLGG